MCPGSTIKRISTPWSAFCRVMVFLLIIGLFILEPAGLPAAFLGLKQPTPIAVEASFLADYRIDAYRIDCEIYADGKVEIQEKLDIHYQQDSKDLVFYLDAGRSRSLNLLSVAISAGSLVDSQPVQLVEVMPAEASSQSQLQSLSYKLTTDDSVDRLKIRTIGHPDEKRQVVIRYELEGALTQLKDAIRFRRTFFSLVGDQPIAKPVLQIQYPSDAASAPAWFSPVSTVPFMATVIDENSIQMSAPLLPARQDMEAVLIMPPEGFLSGAALLPQGIVQDKVAAIGDVEKELGRMTQQTWIAAFLSRMTWILLIVALFILTFLLLVFEREGLLRLIRKQDQQTGFVDAPAYRPALLARLSRHHHPGQIVLATLMDLVLRGKLRLDGHVLTLLAKNLPDYQGMSAFEIFLLQWFFEKITHEDTISTAQIRKYALDRRTAAEFSAYYEQFIHLIQEELVQADLLDLKKRHQGKLIGLSLAGAYVLASLLILWGSGALGLLLLLPAGGFAAFGLGLKHLTRQGNIEAARARKFRKQLSHYARFNKDQDEDPQIDSERLAPAVALGVSRLFLQQLIEKYGENRSLASQFLTRLTQSLTEDANKIEHFTRDLEAMDSMLSASLYLALGIHFYD